MRIGLDLDGLLDERPDFSAFLTAALRSAGGDFAGTIFREDWQLKWDPRTEPALIEQNLYGDTVESARANLVEALELFFESADKTEIARRLHTEVFVTRVEVAVG